MKSVSRAQMLPFVLWLSVAAASAGAGVDQVPPPSSASANDAAAGTPSKKVPENTILVKGAWPSASDTITPLPEGGRFAESTYRNEYFGLAFPFSNRWQKGLEGPPVSDSGYYQLAQIVAADSFKQERPGHVLIAAQDIFFTPTQATSALELVNFSRDHLDASVYKVERAPTEVKLGTHSYIRFDYQSPVAQMHWSVLATQIRCHVVEFVFTSRQPKVLNDLVKAMEQVQLPSEAGVHAGSGGGETPVCIKDYASEENIIEGEAPILTEPRYNRIPVRIIIDRQGKVKHIHFLRAFPDQAKTITDVLLQWQFKPHLVNGQPVEVETGIMFGRKARQTPPPVGHQAVRSTTTSLSPQDKSSDY
jgi:hypothetical protein